MADRPEWQESAASDVAAHTALTHNIHGIADTALLELITRKGQANGYAGLDASGHVPPGLLPLSGAYMSLRGDFGLTPAMAVGALTTAIQDAINAAVAAGKGLDLGADMWPINDRLQIPGNLSIRAAGAYEVWDTVQHSSQTEVPGAAPWVAGGGFIQKTAAKNIIEIPATGACVHLRDMVLRFDDAIAFQNTGHGIYAVPTALYNTKPDNGPAACRWDNVVVFGHDGNHYAFYLVNFNYPTMSHLRGYGGGGIYYECSTDYYTNYGNAVIINPYFNLFCSGSAHGYHLKSGSAGSSPNLLNLITMLRPQVNAYDVSAAALKAAFPAIVTPPNSATQLLYKDENDPLNVTLIDPDFELGPYTCIFGKRTTILGSDGTTAVGLNNSRHGRQSLPLSVTGSNNTGIGFNALGGATTANVNTAVGSKAAQAVTTGGNNTAVGYQALAACTVNGNNTAIGTNSLVVNTGSSNTALGYNTLAATTTGAQNTALGVSAGAANTTGQQNTAAGVSAMQSNTTGSNNTAIGTSALQSNTTGSRNTAVGQNASSTNTVVNNSTAIGYGASANAGGAVAIGIDNGGTGASTSTTNEFVLGTNQHLVKIAGRLTVAQRTPSSTADAQGSLGDLASDDNYVYAKTSTGWKRAALATF